MAVRKSIVLTPLVPAAENDLQLFSECVQILAGTETSVIEYYTPPQHMSRTREILSSHNMDTVLLIALIQKRNNWNLSAANVQERTTALGHVMEHMASAREAGISKVLITSGRRSLQYRQEQAAYESLKASIGVLLQTYGKEMEIFLEPGDHDIDAFQTIGNTIKAVNLMKDISGSSGNISLTMDTSHLAQLGEDPCESIEAAAQFCGHIHMANCILDPGHPLYGDKHPLFSDPEGYYSPEDLKGIGLEFMEKWSTRKKDLIIGCEVISRTAGRFGWLEQVLTENAWFYGPRRGISYGDS